jgi:predicted RND superfamily exporter protein
MRVFFSDENPQLKALDALENTYTKNENVLFVVAPKNGDVFTRATLAAIEELTEASWKMPYSSRVDSITNFQHTRAEEDDLIVEDLVTDAPSLSDEELDAKRAIALSEPLLVNRLVSPSGHATGVLVTMLLPHESLAEAPEVAAFARALADEVRRKNPGIGLHLTGTVIMDSAFAEAAEADYATLYPAMFVVLLVIIGLALRSFVGTFATLIVVLFSTLTGLGLAGWLGMTMTTASTNAPIIILVLAVADSVHILATRMQRLRRGDSRHEAVAESLRVNLQPVFLTSVTTAIGFLSMNFSDVPPFRNLGNIVAMGVMAAFFYSVLLLPALLAVLPARQGRRDGRAASSHLGWLAEFVIRRRRLVLSGTIAAVVVLTAGTTQIELGDDWIKYFDPSFDIRRATDFAEDNLTGFHAIEYSLSADDIGGISDPEYLKTVEEFAAWYRSQPKVVNVDAITEIFKRLNRNLHSDDDEYYRIPEDRDLAAQYLLLYEMSLPFGLDLNNQINVDRSATRMVVTLRGTTTNELRETEDRADEWLSAHGLEDMASEGSGLSVIWAHLAERNIHAMLGASFWALVLISGILMLALRSVKLGLLSLIPNLAPAFVAFGVWGFTVGQVGLGLSVIVSMTIGIVVDDTVHFLSKYLRARREHGLSSADAVRYAFSTVGTAMWVTTLALVAGYLVLSFSHFRMNSDMAVMTAMTITLALVLDFLLLPALLMKTEEKTDEKSVADAARMPVSAAAGGEGRVA